MEEPPVTALLLVIWSRRSWHLTLWASWASDQDESLKKLALRASLAARAEELPALGCHRALCLECQLYLLILLPMSLQTLQTLQILQGAQLPPQLYLLILLLMSLQTLQTLRTLQGGHLPPQLELLMLLLLP